ncbi:uncharacterized protein LOC110975374 [Acanthaster planci]|uniref:Uncharacterized protein LOC110975374 n=1 Tax=Acanthaster planci TaxID=133434 RepID=A0A8B7XUC3_ACAPL|nr:uncharacterized protein LOC110975374 [Acanthaster planci]
MASFRSFGLAFCVFALGLCGARGVETEIVVVNGTVAGTGNLEAEKGDNITLRCEVRGLAQGDSIVWQYDLQDLTTNGRIEVTPQALPSRVDHSLDDALVLTISHVSVRDDGTYVCLVRRPSFENPVGLIDADQLTLKVYSFPDDRNPACAPNGPLTVSIGEKTTLTCSTIRGQPTVNLTISSMGSAPSSLVWSRNGNGDRISQSANWTANVSQDELVFICEITSSRYPDERRNCTMGPIRVEQSPNPTTPQPGPTDMTNTVQETVMQTSSATPPTSGPATTSPRHLTTTAGSSSTRQSATKERDKTVPTESSFPRRPATLLSPSSLSGMSDEPHELTSTEPLGVNAESALPWLVAFAVVTFLLILSLVAIVMLCLKIRHMRGFNWTVRTDALMSRSQHEKQKAAINGTVNGAFHEIPLNNV